MTRRPTVPVRATLPAAALAAVALAAPPAAADRYGCDIALARQDDLTGYNYEGFAVGEVVADVGEVVTISCVVTVNGSLASGTPSGAGRTVAVTAGRLTFAAGPADVVRVCTVATVDGAAFEYCEEPPDPVADVMGEAARLTGFVDPVVCPPLGSAAGRYGPVVVEEEGDVVFIDDPLYDCPPYGA